MTLQINRKLFTVEEYHKLAEVGILNEDDRVELIRGEIITISPINSTHAGIVDSLVEFLIINLYKKATIKCQNPLIISEQSEPEPDIAIVQYKPDSYRSAHPKPQETHLVIEVADSTLAFDRTMKAELYAQAGIPEYWIINIVDQQVEIHRQPKNGEYHFKQIISETASIQAQSINFSIEYTDIFR